MVVGPLLGSYHSTDLKTLRQRDATLARVTELATGGDVDAQMLIGKTLFNGRIVARDDAAAFEWFRKAAAQKNDEARELVAKMTYEVRGTQQDDAAALTLIELADGGNTDAQAYAGKFYRDGIHMPRDDAKAASYFAQAAKAGSWQASLEYAKLLQVGRGVPADAETALASLWEIATEHGSPEAIYLFAFAFRDGIGTTADPEKAEELLAYAVRAEFPGAKAAYDDILRQNGPGKPRPPPESP